MPLGGNPWSGLYIACAAGGIVWLKFRRRSRDPKKGSGDEAFEIFLAASPLVAAQLRRQLSLDWYSGSAAKSPSPSAQYRQLCRLAYTLPEIQGYLFQSSGIWYRYIC